MKVLECSTAGDRRFSAFGAYVDFFGVSAPIETHYQLAKQFGTFSPTHWREAKGRTDITHIKVCGHEFDAKYLSQFYIFLWIMYLDKNPHLVAHAKKFDHFTDRFRGNSINCQADVIRDYVKKGRAYCLSQCGEFAKMLLAVLKCG